MRLQKLVEFESKNKNKRNSDNKPVEFSDSHSDIKLTLARRDRKNGGE